MADTRAVQPQFLLGYEGMPRRYHVYPQVFQPLNVMSSVGASVLAVAYILPFFYLFWSLRYGKPAGPNPWGATGLEWQVESPPSVHNFHEPVVVTCEPYMYSPEEAERDHAHVQHVHNA